MPPAPCLRGGASADVADSYRECIDTTDRAYCDALFPREFVYENGSRFVRGRDGLYFYEYVDINGRIVRDERAGAGYPTIESIVEDLSRGPSLPPGHYRSCPCGPATISSNSCASCPPAYFPPSTSVPRPEDYIYLMHRPRPLRVTLLSPVAPSRTRYSRPRITPGTPPSVSILPTWLLRNLLGNSPTMDSGSGLGPRSGGER